MLGMNIPDASTNYRQLPSLAKIEQSKCKCGKRSSLPVALTPIDGSHRCRHPAIVIELTGPITSDLRRATDNLPSRQLTEVAFSSAWLYLARIGPVQCYKMSL
jgi:hypothetical protein